MAGVWLGTQREIIEVNEIGLDFGDSEAHNVLKVINELLIGKARQVSKGLLVSVFNHHRLAKSVALNPVLGARLLNKEGLVHDRIPLNVGVDLHPEPMHNFRGTHSVFHLRSFSGHAEAFVKMGMKDLDPLVLKLADYLFTLLVFVDLPGIQALAATTHGKQMRFMRASRIDESVFNPGPLLNHAVGITVSIEGECRPGPEFCQSDATGDGSHKVSSVHPTPV